METSKMLGTENIKLNNCAKFSSLILLKPGNSENDLSKLIFCVFNFWMPVIFYGTIHSYVNY